MSGWDKLGKVHRPGTLEEAVGLVASERVAPLAGGSYLLTDRPEEIQELVDLGSLLDDGIEVSDEALLLGAGVKLQQLIDGLNGSPFENFIESARKSSRSKNLRNQRTLGGEVVRGRVDSDLRVALEALNPTLILAGGQAETVTLVDWDGSGIITNISIPVTRLQSLKFERFALLENAPAFLVAASVLDGGNYDVAVGGRASQIKCWTLPGGGNGSGEVVEQATGLFREDYTGTLEYKRQLLTTALRRMGVIQ